MQSIYNVSVVPQNLRKEETIVQIGQSLNYLSKVSIDIFKRINNRVEINNKSLNDLSSRIEAVNSKISKLTGAKKAIQVFSSSKYPAVDINRNYKTIFVNENCPEKTKFDVSYKDAPIRDEPLETLQFYHVKVVDANRNNCDGLGEIPKCAESINDLLLYNSGKNPYNKYVMSDTLHMLQTSKREDVTEGEEIVAAPLSISEKSSSTKINVENYFYSPNLGDVPKIDVPPDLPDLPGIADDLRYVNDTGPGIAPSVTTTPSIPDLPEIIPSDETTEKFPSEIPITPLTRVPPEVITFDKEIIEPNKIEDVQIEIKEVNEIVVPKYEEKKLDVNHVNNAHASLMDAIRQAGGSKKLRSTEAKPEEKRQESRGGDFMADLHAKLSLRRKGISGAKNINGVEKGTAMDRISAMIPDPSPKTDQYESATTDDDWDD